MATLSLRWTEYPPPEFTGGAVTVGNFDGVHLGHRALVAAAKKWATQLGGPTVAVTFDPPPVALLNPSATQAPLSTLADRAARLYECGADHVLILKTDAGLLSLSPEAFFEDVLTRMLRARAVVEGHNFRFGRGRAGDTRQLRELCQSAGIAFEEVRPVDVRGELVSSSRVRAALNAGDIATASELLGRPYRIAGTVVEGAKRGRTIGFPTANLDGIETLVPAVGVYAARAWVDDRVYSAAANIGPNPTFGEDARKIEIHLLDYAGNLYGRRLAVEFVAKLRDTRPFGSAGELVEQLKKDVETTRKVVGLL